MKRLKFATLALIVTLGFFMQSFTEFSENESNQGNTMELISESLDVNVGKMKGEAYFIIEQGPYPKPPICSGTLSGGVSFTVFEAGPGHWSVHETGALGTHVFNYTGPNASLKAAEWCAALLAHQ